MAITVFTLKLLSIIIALEGKENKENGGTNNGSNI